MIPIVSISWLHMTIKLNALPFHTRVIFLLLDREGTTQTLSYGTTTQREQSSDYPNTITKLHILPFLTMIYFWFQQATLSMENFSFGTQLTVTSSRLSRLQARSSLMESRLSVLEALWKTLSSETPLTISLLLLAQRNWLSGLWTQVMDSAPMNHCRLEQWWETINASHSQNQTKSSCL